MSCCKDDDSQAARYQCQKYRIEVCENCLACKDPDLYCKFRSSCVIHFLEKERRAAAKK